MTQLNWYKEKTGFI